MERELLAACIDDRSAYDKLYELEAQNELSDKGKILFKAISNYYQNDDNAVHVDKELLARTLSRTYPKYAEMFTNMVRNLETSSSINVVVEFKALQKQQIGLRLSTALLEGKEKDIPELMDMYNAITDEDKEEDVYDRS